MGGKGMRPCRALRSLTRQYSAHSAIFGVLLAGLAAGKGVRLSLAVPSRQSSRLTNRIRRIPADVAFATEQRTAAPARSLMANSRHSVANLCHSVAGLCHVMAEPCHNSCCNQRRRFGVSLITFAHELGLKHSQFRFGAAAIATPPAAGFTDCATRAHSDCGRNLAAPESSTASRTSLASSTAAGAQYS